MLEPWRFHVPNSKPVLLCAYFFAIQIASGCAAPIQVYKLYPGPTLNSSEVATIRLADGSPIIVDGLNVSAGDYDVVAVLPGSHRLAGGFVYSIARSEKWDADLRYPIDCQAGNPEVMLHAGTTYWVRKSGNGLKVLDSSSGTTIWRCGEP
jgi:hypothetical protein